MTSDHSETDRAGRDGHEDVEDWLETVEQFTKSRWLVSEPDRIPEWTTKALKLATTMPGGPAYLRFPRDVLYTSNMRAGIYPSGTLAFPRLCNPTRKDVEEAARMLLEAKALFSTWARRLPHLALGHPLSSLRNCWQFQ